METLRLATFFWLQCVHPATNRGVTRPQSLVVAYYCDVPNLVLLTVAQHHPPTAFPC